MAAGLLSFPVLAALSVVLLVVHVLLQSSIATKELGRHWNAGPRDEGRKPKSALAGRAARASANFRETYPAFVVLVLALAINGDAWHLGFAGALLWFAARIIYIPLYLGGVPYIRSLVWVAGMVGLAMMAVAIVIPALWR